jgi:hypothetical protein
VVKLAIEHGKLQAENTRLRDENAFLRDLQQQRFKEPAS